MTRRPLSADVPEASLQQKYEQYDLNDIVCVLELYVETCEIDGRKFKTFTALFVIVYCDKIYLDFSPLTYGSQVHSG